MNEQPRLSAAMLRNRLNGELRQMHGYSLKGNSRKPGKILRWLVHASSSGKWKIISLWICFEVVRRKRHLCAGRRQVTDTFKVPKDNLDNPRTISVTLWVTSTYEKRAAAQCSEDLGQVVQNSREQEQRNQDHTFEDLYPACLFAEINYIISKVWHDTVVEFYYKQIPQRQHLKTSLCLLYYFVFSTFTPTKTLGVQLTLEQHRLNSTDPLVCGFFPQ